MKKLSIIATVLAMVVFFTSCNFLDTRAQSEFDAAFVFSDPTLAEGALMGAYFVLGYNNSYRNRHMIHTFSNTDTEIHRESLAGLGETGRRAAAVFNLSAHMGPDMATNPSMFCFSYMAIERLNLIIQSIPRYGNMNNPAFQHIYGEALALRAFFYFDLIKWYGDVPARFEPVSSATVFLPRADRDIIYRQILDDLERAAELLPWPGDAASYNRVDRMNQAFARAFRARVALHAGGYSLRNDNGQAVIRRSSPDSPYYLNRREMYEIARLETAYLMENYGRGFRLDPDFENIFRQNVQENVSVGRESIFQLPYSAGERGQWLAFFGARHVGPDRFSQAHVSGEAGPTAIMWYWFADNDVRRDVSIIHHLYAAASPSTAIQQIQTAAPGGGTNNSTIRTAYFGRLRAEWSNRRIMTNDDGIQPIIMRYADVLLMFAEAENFLNGNTDARNAAFAQVRNRAFPNGGDPLNFASLDQNAFFHAIMDERAFEFLGEQRRKYDLNRWGMLRERLEWAQRQTRRLRDNPNDEYSWTPEAPRDIDFRGFSRHIYWRHVPGRFEGHTVLEIFGLRRGEFPLDENGEQIIPTGPQSNPAGLTAWQESFRGATPQNPWNRYVGTGTGTPPPLQMEWIDSRNTANGHPLSDYFITNAFFMPGPGDPVHGGFGDAAHGGHRHNLTLEQRSLFPIWAVPVLNSQGHIQNFPWWD